MVFSGPESSHNSILSAELERCLLEVLSDCVPPIHADQLLCNPRLKPLLSSQPGNGEYIVSVNKLAHSIGKSKTNKNRMIKINDIMHSTI